jgi:hypothetical protein
MKKSQREAGFFVCFRVFSCEEMKTCGRSHFPNATVDVLLHQARAVAADA